MLTFTISGLYGEFAKAIGRNIGGHWVPKEKSLANSFNKHGYNKRAAARGEAAGDFLNTSGSFAGSMADASKYGKAVTAADSFLLMEDTFVSIFQMIAEGVMWSEPGNPNPRGSY